MTHSNKILTLALIAGSILSPLAGCNAAPATSKQGEKQAVASAITDIGSDEQFKKLLENSKDELLVFKLYADWCGPCKILTPTMEKIAREHGKQARFFKIDVDKLPAVAGMFGVNSIPMVVMVKNGKSVDGYVGVRAEKDYVLAIEKHGTATTGPSVQ